MFHHTRSRTAGKALRLPALILILALLLSACLPAGAEAPAALRGYDPAAGYVYVSLGVYPQTAQGDVRPILWRVLTVDREKAYLCSEYILFARPMHPSLKEYRDVLRGDFGQTELCHYLNTTFAEEAFPGAELDMLLPCENYGKVFLLDAEDVLSRAIGMGRETNLRQSPGLRAWGTEYAIANGLFVYSAKYGKHSPYWVRNQSTTDARHARCTKEKGTLGHIEVGRANEGVRPAVYLDLGSCWISGGSGTMEDPYTLVPVVATEPVTPAEVPAEVLVEVPVEVPAEP